MATRTACYWVGALSDQLLQVCAAGQWSYDMHMNCPVRGSREAQPCSVLPCPSWPVGLQHDAECGQTMLVIEFRVEA